MKDNTPQIIICDCNSPEHQLIVTSDEDFIYLHIHLIKRGFWSRVKYAIKYIFGYKCKYGAWDEILLGPQHVGSFQEITDKLKSLKQ